MRRAAIAAAAAAGLAAIVWAQHGPIRHDMQDDLSARSRQALAAAGLSDVEVDFVGQDGTVRARTAAQGEQAVAIVAKLEGVRVVVAQVPSAVAAAPAPPIPAVASPSATPSVSTPPTLPPSPTPAPQQVQARLIELAPVTFLDSSATLTPAGERALRQAASILLSNPKVRVRIEGHTDDNGTDESNLALSRQRANTVLDFLLRHGVSAERMTAQGYGERRPKVPNTSEANRAINRRVDFIVLK